MAPATHNPLPYNPSVLAWARERRGLSVEEAASAANVKPDRIVGWEAGERKPTVGQGRKLAEIYGRPFLEFFAKARPDVPEVALVADFRFHRILPSDAERIGLEEVQRWAEEQRLNALSLYRDIGEAPPDLPVGLRFKLEDSPTGAAKVAREMVDFPIAEQVNLKTNKRYRLPIIIREKFDDLGVLVLKNNEIQKLRARGICFFAEPLPVIVFGNEAPGGQAFTLCHEFAHVALGVSGIPGFQDSAPEAKAESQLRTGATGLPQSS